MVKEHINLESKVRSEAEISVSRLSKQISELTKVEETLEDELAEERARRYIKIFYFILFLQWLMCLFEKGGCRRRNYCFTRKIRCNEKITYWYPFYLIILFSVKSIFIFDCLHTYEMMEDQHQKH